MPRPARSIWVTRAYARRRHKSWMLSMTLASLGWGTWWIMLFVRKVIPGLSPGLLVPSAISTTFAIVGLGIAVLTFRARRSWMLFVTVPVLANTSLLFMPWLAAEITGES